LTLYVLDSFATNKSTDDGSQPPGRETYQEPIRLETATTQILIAMQV